MLNVRGQHDRHTMQVPMTVAESGRFELVCSGCGYRISVSQAPAFCPMCQRDRWRSSEADADRAGSGVVYRKRPLNEALHGVGAIGDLSIAFFPECDDDRCDLPVFLTAHEYEGARANPEWMPLCHDPAAADDPLSRGAEEFEPILLGHDDRFDSLCESLRGVPLS